MSSLVYPVLPGLTWPARRSPQWSTRRRRTASGRRFATSYWTTPIYVYRLAYEFLRRDANFAELEALHGFFNQLQGGLDTFLYLDPDDNAVTAQSIGVGDGVSVDFPLLRAIGSAADPVGAKNGAITVTVAGSPTSAYTLLEDRIVRFNTAPTAGQALAWTGSYYMRCAFVEDSMDFEKFMAGLWSLDGVEFESIKG